MFKIKKGLDIPISGKPSNELTDKPTSNNVGVIASDYVGMKPTMLVKVGDQVSLGQKLIEDNQISRAVDLIRGIRLYGKKNMFFNKRMVNHNDNFKKAG